MAYTKYSLTPANNNAAPPDGAPEGMLPSAVNDTMRDMMAQIRDVGDGIRGGTYTMTAPVITGGSITGVALSGNTFTNPVITGGSINNTPIGATTASTGRFSTITGTGLTSGRVTYATTNGQLTDDADFTFNGTTVTMANDASISGLTVGKGGGAVGGSTALGNGALAVNTTGVNTSAGYQALYTVTTGTGNTAFGNSALKTTTANYNNAFGENALVFTTTGANNNAFGTSALQTNTTGGANTALGNFALYSNTTASNNTAVGYQAGYSNVTGTPNTYLGTQAGYNATSNFNTFVGYQAGYSNTSGAQNNFFGHQAGYTVTTGGKNTILGGYNGNQGGLDIRTSSNNVVLSDGDGNVKLWSDSTGKINIGQYTVQGAKLNVVETATNDKAILRGEAPGGYTASMLELYGNRTTTNGTYKLIEALNGDATGLFRVLDSGNAQNTNNSYGGTSDIKLKENIVDATPKLKDLCKVKVRHYNFIAKPEEKQIGVIAQELEEVFAGLVEETADKDVDGNDLGTTTKAVKYSVFVPMLIKALQELKAEVDSLKAQLNNGA